MASSLCLPALAISQEIADYIQVFRGYVWRLDVDGVQPSNDAVVGERHLGRNIIRGMRGLQCFIRFVAGISRRCQRTSLENGSVKMSEYG